MSSSRWGKSAARVAVFLAGLLMLSACRVDALVDIEVEADGSGHVTVDARFDGEAVEQLGLTDGLPLADLADAGWRLTPLEALADGGVRATATKDFHDEASLQATLDEIAGGGVFRDVTLATADEFGAREHRLSFDVDLTDGWAVFEPLSAVSSPALQQAADGRSPNDVVSMRVDARVVASDASDEGFDATAVAPVFGEVSRVVVNADAEVTNAQLLRWIALAMSALAALSIVLFFVGRYVDRRVGERVRTPKRLASRIPGNPDSGVRRRGARGPGGSGGSRGSGPRGHDPSGRSPSGLQVGRPVRLVVVEPRTVLLDGDTNLASEVLAFARTAGAAARGDSIVDEIADVAVGRVDTTDFWLQSGAIGSGAAHADAPVDARAGAADAGAADAGDAMALAAAGLDRSLVEARTLRRSTARMLRSLDERAIAVAAVSNDGRTWAELTREVHRLQGVSPWLASGEVGATKPDTGLFERLRRETNVPYRDCLYIDTSIEHLDAARELGMRTALYAAPGVPVPDVPGHPVVRDLVAVIKRLPVPAV